MNEGEKDMTKSEFIEAVAEKANLSKKDAEAALNAVLTTVEDVLVNDDKIKFIGFGSFEVKNRPARMGRNPRTNEPMEIKEAKIPVFKAGKVLKDKIN